VLKSLDLPSVLVEAGYVSNADDVRSMTDKAGARVLPRRWPMPSRSFCRAGHRRGGAP
jgi:hypothetical protein